MKSESDVSRIGVTRSELAELEKDFVYHLDNLLAEIDDSDEITAKTMSQVGNRRADMGQNRVARAISKKKPRPALPVSYKWKIQALMFELCGVTLVTPLISLLNIAQCHTAPSQLPGQPVWRFGVLMHRKQRVIVVDTARLIMPERIDSERKRQPLCVGYLLIVGAGDIALMIDKICTTEKLEKSDIRWRRPSVSQSWIAGIVTNQLSVLLDVDGLLDELKAA